MKTKSAFIVGLLALAMLPSCVKDDLQISPSGELTTVSHHFDNYERLEVSHEFDVQVTFSETQEEIRVEAHSDLQSYIVVEKHGHTLEIRFDRNLNLRSGSTPKVFISTKNISTYRGSGAITIQLTNPLHTPKVDISMSGASRFDATLVTDVTKLDLSGHAEIDLAGQSDQFILHTSGRSEVSGYDFIANKFDGDLSGSSDIQIFVNESIDVVASGESTIKYKGNAVINSQRLIGNAKIINVN